VIVSFIEVWLPGRTPLCLFTYSFSCSDMCYETRQSYFWQLHNLCKKRVLYHFHWKASPFLCTLYILQESIVKVTQISPDQCS